MRSPRALLAPCCGLLAAFALTGCNAMLGIDEPKEPMLSEVNEHPEPASDSGSAAPARDAGHADGGGSAVDAGTPLTADDVSPHAFAAWPMPRPMSEPGDGGSTQQFGTRGPGVLKDLVTNLEWQLTAEAMPRTRDEAETYCKALALAGGGFRLPSRIELMSLIDFTHANPNADPMTFVDMPLGKYWSASRYAVDTKLGWLVNFQFSTSLVSIEASDTPHLVRCVR